QIVAIALTYAAVSLSFIPLAVSELAKKRDAGTKTQNLSVQDPEKTATVINTPQSANAKGDGPTSPVGALAALFLIALASPFLELQSPVSGLIGLVILYVGMQFAWKSTAGSKVPVAGPFKA